MTSDALREQLAEFISIPSVSADADHAADIVAAAEWVAGHIRRTGGTAELVPWGTRPLVIGKVEASAQPESVPTILCYAHFDVQPPDPLDLWESPPFELTQRDDRLWARGVADDKGNMFVMVEAARQLAEEGSLPVNVRFAFDGEEEVGGDSIEKWVEADDGPADAALILDGGMIRRGQPAFTVGVRGMVYLHLRVRTGSTDMHSGMFGLAALNASHALMTALSAVLPGREDGRLREELRVGVAPPSTEELAAWAQLPAGSVQLSDMGATPIVPGAEAEFYDRTFADTSLDVNGIASGSPDLIKTVLPVEARANVSMRLAPGQDPETIREAFEKLVREALPAGAELEIALRNSARPALTPSDSDALRLAGDAFENVVGTRPFLVRSGGTLPIYASLVARGLPTFATGFPIENECNVHAPNENIPEGTIELGVATMRDVFTRLGELGS